MRTTPWFVLAALTGACASGETLRSSEAGPTQAAGPLLVTDMDGTAHDLDEVLGEGRAVALVFWQTWCASCIREAPQLAADARAFSEDILFVGVVPGTDEYVDDEEVERKARELGLPYPQIRDRDLALSKRFAVTGTPTIVVLGKQGRILFRGHEPPEDWSVWAQSPSR